MQSNNWSRDTLMNTLSEEVTTMLFNEQENHEYNCQETDCFHQMHFTWWLIDWSRLRVNSISDGTILETLFDSWESVSVSSTATERKRLTRAERGIVIEHGWKPLTWSRVTFQLTKINWSHNFKTTKCINFKNKRFTVQFHTFIQCNFWNSF